MIKKTGHRHRHRHWLLIAITLISSPVATQGLADETSSPTERINRLNELARQVQSNAPRQSIDHAREALAIAVETSDRDAEARSLNNLGVGHYYLAEYVQALDYYKRALAVAESIQADPRIADAVNNIGIIHYVWGQYDKTLERYSQGLEINRRLEDRAGIAAALNNIGNVYYATGRYTEALDYFAEALPMYEGLGELNRVASTLNNSGLAYLRLGDFDEALSRFNRALTMGRNLDDNAGLAFSLNNVGVALDRLDRPSEARAFYEQALAIRRKTGDRQGIAIGLHNLGQALFASGERETALDYLREALKIAREIEVKEVEVDILETVSEIYEATGSFEPALESHKQLQAVRNQLFDETTARRLADQRALYDFEKKDRELDVLRTNQRVDRWIRNFVVGCAVLLICLVGLLFVLNRFKDRANKEMKRAHDALASAQLVREKSIRAELAHVNRFATLGELAAGLTHELRTPLMGVSLNARATQKLVAGDGSAREVEEALEDIVDGAGKAHEIIQRLRKLIRHGEIARKSINVNELIRDLEPVARKDLTIRGVALRFDLEPVASTVVAGDGVQIQQAVLNLIYNGSEAVAGSESRTVTVHTSQHEGDAILVAVSDTGPTLDDETFERIFEPFFTTKAEGMGMGLRICRTIVEAHGGRLWATRDPEFGLRVQFTLQRASAVATRAPAATVSE